MKRTGVLNAELSGVLATLGHTDLLLVVDAGFPIPRTAHRVDLAIAEDLPSLTTVLDLIADEIIVEGVVVAEDVTTHNKPLADWLGQRFPGVPLSTRQHAEMLGELAGQAKAIVRTGAFNPWGNVGLICGVDVPRWFDEPGIIVPDYYRDRM
ncbi:MULTISPECIES: D-ribose pyranase [unclassified Micromonospora]|uniref:D-ribose pyranase n=1 Tax=unclassified Micromonospora TaxID=2617518 RepID=UPI0022B6A5AE|nr:MULTISPECIES: D-ribose pyranase [unclassified Micromonospora]MCZ7418447.1 D-ribose pyranase [Verrucosispora sp. WMMA2121]WBB92172.1 D-ribose pyranase [Verrucosispora sp. WMMC514]